MIASIPSLERAETTRLRSSVLKYAPDESRWVRAHRGSDRARELTFLNLSLPRVIRMECRETRHRTRDTPISASFWNHSRPSNRKLFVRTLRRAEKVHAQTRTQTHDIYDGIYHGEARGTVSKYGATAITWRIR